MQSATYANTIENVTANIPETATAIKYALKKREKVSKASIKYARKGFNHTGFSFSPTSLSLSPSLPPPLPPPSLPLPPSLISYISYMELKRSIGIGAQVIKTARRRKDFRPHASERAPIRGADRKERIPW